MFGSQKKYRLVVFNLDFAPTKRRTDVFDTNLLLIRFDRNFCLSIFTKWILNSGFERRLDWEIFSFFVILRWVELEGVWTSITYSCFTGEKFLPFTSAVSRELDRDAAVKLTLDSRKSPDARRPVSAQAWLLLVTNFNCFRVTFIYCSTSSFRFHRFWTGEFLPNFPWGSCFGISSANFSYVF